MTNVIHIHCLSVYSITLHFEHFTFFVLYLKQWNPYKQASYMHMHALIHCQEEQND